jgi:hypothetical protein
MNIINTISLLWVASSKKPQIPLVTSLVGKSNDEILVGKTGVVFVQGHAIGVKNGVTSEPITAPIICAAWV